MTESRKKIVILGPTHPYRGGISHYTTLLCRELRRDHEVRMISFRRQFPMFLYPGGKSDKDPSQEKLAVEGTEYVLDTINPLTWGATARAVLASGPDMVIVPWWIAHFAPAFWSVLRKIKKRSDAEIVLWCHNVIDHESTGWKRLASQKVFALADRFVVHSEEDRKNLLVWDPKAKVAKGYLPTTADLSARRIKKDEAKTQLGLAGPVLLFFGYVRHYKGLPDMLEALARVRKVHPDVTLLIVGQFWKGQEIHLEKIGPLGLEDAVRVIDEYIPNEEIGLYFGTSDIVALPYLSATGSAVVQLAFGFDRPVVATAVGSLPEVVDDGQSGRLTPPSNPEAFAQAILEILDPTNLEKYTARAGEAKKRFGWEGLVKAIIDEETEVDRP